MNMLNGLGDGGAFLDSNPASPYLGPRRHSIGDPLDAPAAHSNEPILPPRSHSPSAHALIEHWGRERLEERQGCEHAEQEEGEGRVVSSCRHGKCMTTDHRAERMFDFSFCTMLRASVRSS